MLYGIPVEVLQEYTRKLNPDIPPKTPDVFFAKKDIAATIKTMQEAVSNMSATRTLSKEAKAQGSEDYVALRSKANEFEKTAAASAKKLTELQTKLARVKESIAKRWPARLNEVNTFFNNYALYKVTGDIISDLQKRNSFDYDFESLKNTLITNIVDPGVIDGGEYAIKLANEKHCKIVKTIAAHPTNIGGSFLRVNDEKGVGDAQEEKDQDTSPTAIAAATVFAAKIDHKGDIKYHPEISQALQLKRAALVISGIVNSQKNEFDVICAAAPDIAKSADEAVKYKGLVKDTKTGETDFSDERWDDYILEIHSLYQNIGTAYAQYFQSNEHIVMTTPGSGFFSGNCVYAKLIQGIVLQDLLQSSPELKLMASQGRLHWPWREKTLEQAFKLTHPECEVVFNRVSTVIKTKQLSVDEQLDASAKKLKI